MEPGDPEMQSLYRRMVRMQLRLKARAESMYEDLKRTPKHERKRLSYKTKKDEFRRLVELHAKVKHEVRQSPYFVIWGYCWVDSEGEVAAADLAGAKAAPEERHRSGGDDNASNKKPAQEKEAVAATSSRRAAKEDVHREKKRRRDDGDCIGSSKVARKETVCKQTSLPSKQTTTFKQTSPPSEQMTPSKQKTAPKQTSPPSEKMTASKQKMAPKQTFPPSEKMTASQQKTAPKQTTASEQTAPPSEQMTPSKQKMAPKQTSPPSEKMTASQQTTASEQTAPPSEQMTTSKQMPPPSKQLTACKRTTAFKQTTASKQTSPPSKQLTAPKQALSPSEQTPSPSKQTTPSPEQKQLTSAAKPRMDTPVPAFSLPSTIRNMRCPSAKDTQLRISLRRNIDAYDRAVRRHQSDRNAVSDKDQDDSSEEKEAADSPAAKVTKTSGNTDADDDTLEEEIDVSDDVVPNTDDSDAEDDVVPDTDDSGSHDNDESSEGETDVEEAAVKKVDDATQINANEGAVVALDAVFALDAGDDDCPPLLLEQDDGDSDDTVVVPVAGEEKVDASAPSDAGAAAAASVVEPPVVVDVVRVKKSGSASPSESPAESPPSLLSSQTPAVPKLLHRGLGNIKKRISDEEDDGDIEFLEVKESTRTGMMSCGGDDKLERSYRMRKRARMQGTVIKAEAVGDGCEVILSSEAAKQDEAPAAAAEQALPFDAEKKVFEYEKQVAEILMKHQPSCSDLVKKYFELAPFLRPSMIAILLTIHPLQRRAVLKDIQAVLPPIAALQSAAEPLVTLKAKAHLQLSNALDNKSSLSDNMPLIWSWLSGSHGDSDSYLFAAP